MNIVIVGDGKVGRALTEQLTREGHNIVIVDTNPKVIDEIVNSLDVLGISGNGASYEVQMEAGVDKADLLIAATSSDEINILCCLVAKKIGAKSTIARVRNPEYSKQLTFMRNELGLSLAINPELSAANEIFRILRFPAALKIDSFSRGKVDLVELKVTESSQLDDTALYALEKKYRIKILVCAVQRGENVYIPSGDFILRAGDKIHITGAPKAVDEFIKAVGIVNRKIKTVMLVGGGKIAYYLARQLIGIGMEVKIIEKDEKRANELSDLLPEALIIHADGADHDVLEAEGIDTVDALVALTGMDEENIIISVYANSKTVDKVIAKVNRQSLIGMLGSVGVETVISPKDITASNIVRYVRAMQNSLGSKVQNLLRIVENRAEALEFRASKDSKCLGIPLQDLKTKSNLLIACISRNSAAIIPGGNDKIIEGDSVIVVTTNQYLQDLDDILESE